ncbi:MAG: hypothetical protein RBS43_01605 [Candidatus Cloacimonas sp.]|jgi:hypothetical protein|nr:hypothetical protein [Candidatus Cloacimonas sp.]
MSDDPSDALHASGSNALWNIEIPNGGTSQIYVSIVEDDQGDISEES